MSLEKLMIDRMIKQKTHEGIQKYESLVFQEDGKEIFKNAL